MTNAPAHPLPQRDGSRPSRLAGLDDLCLCVWPERSSSAPLIVSSFSSAWSSCLWPFQPQLWLCIMSATSLQRNESNQASAYQRRDRRTSQPCPVSCLNSCSRSIPAIKLLTFLRQGASIYTIMCATQPISLLPLGLAVGIKLPYLAPSHPISR